MNARTKYTLGVITYTVWYDCDTNDCVAVKIQVICSVAGSDMDCGVTDYGMRSCMVGMIWLCIQLGWLLCVMWLDVMFMYESVCDIVCCWASFDVL